MALIFTTSINPNFEDLKIQQWLTCDGPIEFSLNLRETDWVIFNLGLVGKYLCSLLLNALFSNYFVQIVHSAFESNFAGYT